MWEKKYQQLLKEAHRLSTINRKASDQKLAEANQLLLELETEKVA
ncbi:MAG: Lacal_2735 family protein [Bacteroidales bacterium]|nr:Lacal_2735 family protein [Bacteroidales bacterium]MCF8402730.1 Lacal_2735 family protein [Bacteroidales bacterium]